HRSAFSTALARMGGLGVTSEGREGYLLRVFFFFFFFSTADALTLYQLVTWPPPKPWQREKKILNDLLPRRSKSEMQDMSSMLPGSVGNLYALVLSCTRHYY